MMAPTNRNPASRYRLPQDVLDDQRLTAADKIRLLTEWALDLTDRSTATDEGMAAAPIDRVEKDVRLQDQIAAALATLADQAGDAANPTE
jgi:hypothetical protein